MFRLGTVLEELADAEYRLERMMTPSHVIRLKIDIYSHQTEHPLIFGTVLKRHIEVHGYVLQ